MSLETVQIMPTEIELQYSYRVYSLYVLFHPVIFQNSDMYIMYNTTIINTTTTITNFVFFCLVSLVRWGYYRFS